MRPKYILLTATALAILAPAVPAAAQDQEARDEGEIIVTARKRQESILKVPVTETVLTSAQIQRAQIKDLVDVARRAVGLKLGTASTEAGSLISIRGFGTNATDPGIDQSVSLNLDGLQLTQGMSYVVGTFDMAQVEVLKGPQALFFGKASPAGVIAIRTNDPGDELEVIARTGYEFVAREWRNELILSAPLGDTFGIRIAGMYDDFGGFFFNDETANIASGALPMPHRFGKTKTAIVRGTALFKPTPEFSARLKLNYTRDIQHGSTPGQGLFCPEGTVTVAPPPVAPQFSANEDCKKDRHLSVVGGNPTAFPGLVNNPGGITLLDGGRPTNRIFQKFGSLELNYDIVPSVTLTSMTGYYKLKNNVDHNCYYSGGGAPACMTQKRFTRKEFTQELRANSDLDGPLNFSFGGFYQKGRVYDNETLPGNINYGRPALVFAGEMTIHVKSYSAFGQGRFKIMPELELAAGARWTHEKRNLDSITYQEPFTPFFTAAGAPPLHTPLHLTNPKLDSKNWSPEASITWTPTDDLTVFGSWKRAYKSGSFNIVTPTNPTAAPTLVNGQWVGPGANRSYGDEKIQGWELGLKARLFDRQLNFNLTGYHYKASDLQVGTVQPAAGGLPVLTTLNAAAAKIYGIEADFSFRPRGVEGLEFFGALNWNHARFSDFPNAPCIGGDLFSEGCNRFPGPVGVSFPANAFSAPNNLPPGVSVADLPVALQNGAPFRYTAEDLSGYPLARAPDWTATGGFHYDMPVGSGMKLGLGADFQYSSKYLAIVGLIKVRPWFYQQAYWKFNAHVSLTGPNDGWELAFIGNNLTGKLNVNGISSTSQAGALFFVPGIVGGPTRNAAGIDEAFGFPERGRELWVRLTVRPAALLRREEGEAPPPPPPPPPPMQTCADGSQIPADQVCPAAPPPPPPPPEPIEKAGERG